MGTERKREEIATAKELLTGKMVGFIGGGNMAKAIARGLLSNGVLSANQILVSAPTDSNFADWKSWNTNVTNNNEDVFNKCNIIILAFKPGHIASACKTFPSNINNKTLVSVLAGTSYSNIFPAHYNPVDSKYDFIRVMPNLAVAVGEGSSVLTVEVNMINTSHIVKAMFSSIGVCRIVPGYLMEPLTALVGSGPAYVFMIIEALSDGAVKHGVPRDMAVELSAQLLIGASSMVLDSKKHVGLLKDEVCSPGGTTICGVHELEKGGLRATLMNAVEAAVMRALSIKQKT